MLVPQNEGFADTTVEVWRVEPATGHRIGSHPRTTFAIDETGAFGPVRVNGRKHYELAIVRPDGGAHHFYFEPFTRSNHFVRLLSNRPGEGFAAFTQTSEASTNLVLTRMREFWGDQGAESDVVTVDGVNVMRPDTSPRTGVNLAVLTYDEELDGITDLDKGELSPFNLITFISAIDLAVEASPTGAGTVAVEEFARGSGTSTVVNVPNWPSATDFVTVQFRDDERDDRGFPHW